MTARSRTTQRSGRTALAIPRRQPTGLAVARRSRLTPAVLAVAAGLLAAGAVALVLGSSGGAGRSDGGGPRLLRVTSGGEIATGFAAGGDRIVTVAHVLGRRAVVNGRARVVSNGGARVIANARARVVVNGQRARLLRVDRRSDLALLAAPGLAAHGIDTEAAAGGASARVLRLRNGHTTSLSVHVRRRIVAHVRAPGAARAVTRPALELAARVAPGDSGAPVLSEAGALAGVVFATSSTRDGIAYAVDASAVARLLARD